MIQIILTLVAVGALGVLFWCAKMLSKDPPK